MLSLALLGPARLTMADGSAPPPELLWRKHLGLLAYLARSPRRTRSREHLIGLLWGEKTDSAARHSLREALRIVRRSLGDGLSGEGDLLTLAPDAVSCDTDALERLTAERRWAEAAELVGGEFLEGFTVPDAPPFEDWLAAERVAWRARLADVLVHASGEHAAAGRTDAAVATAELAARIRPEEAAVVAQLMQALTLAGQSGAALARFEALDDPDAATVALARRIRAAHSRPPGRPDQRAVIDLERRTPLVGREAALRSLEDAWQRVAAGTPGVLLVEGDPGLGRTRLLDELVARVVLARATVGRTRLVAADRDAPAHDGLMALTRPLREAPGAAAARPEALATMAHRFPAWAAAFREAARHEPLPPADACREIILAVLDEGPLLLVADDAQWLDAVSLETLEQLVRDTDGAPLGLALSVTVQDQPAVLDRLRSRVGRDVAGATVTLDRLSTDDLATLTAWAFPDAPAAQQERIARRVAADSAGVPLLAAELLRALTHGLDLGAIPTGWPEPLRTLDQTLPGDLPAAIVAATRISFRRLDRAARDTLCATAVLGDRVSAERLAAATGQDLPATWDALDELERQGWLEADTAGYAFVARIAREVVARDLTTPGQRKRFSG